MRCVCVWGGEGRTGPTCARARCLYMYVYHMLPLGFMLGSLRNVSSCVNALVTCGPYLCSGSGDCFVKVWTPQDDACVQTLAGHSGRVLTLAAADDGRLLFSGSR